jgi:preprotein translocase subunit SecE
VARKADSRSKNKPRDVRAARKQQNAVQRFIRETMGELRKVSWPTREEAINLTKVVLIVMIITGAFLGALDYLFLQVFKLILST